MQKCNPNKYRVYYCNYDFDKTLKDDFLIFKSFIRHGNNIINNYNQRIEIFKKGNLISKDEYTLLIKSKSSL